MGKSVNIIPCSGFFTTIEKPEPVSFNAADYAERIALLREKMKEQGVDVAVIYGDREHFCNIEFLCGYDCRFEESLFVVPLQGDCSIFVGNEGMAYSYLIPYTVNRVFYQNFSLQGQPRESLRPLKDLLTETGITPSGKVGVAGFKYMTDGEYDVPAYILNAINDAAGGNICNITHYFTENINGLRIKLHYAKQIAWAEYASCQTAAVALKIIKSLRPGMTELEASAYGEIDFTAINVHPMLNFGPKSVAHGLRSPDNTVMTGGNVGGLCYSVRGSLTSRVGLMAFDEESLDAPLKGSVESFYMPYWSAVGAWYESLHVGAECGKVYDAVMDIIGDKKFGVALNPGHYISTDEWTNSPFAKGCTDKLADCHLQCDIIASSSEPVRTGICEDTLVVAGAELRSKLSKEYPAVYERIVKRQDMLRKVIGFDISDDVLPMNNFVGVYFPYMLNTSTCFSLK